MISLTAPLQYWANGEGGMHFMTLPAEDSHEVRAHAFIYPRGFRSARVECRIGDVTWRTSVFPQKGGSYFLPVKIEVCRRAAIAAGDEVTVELELL